MRRRTIVVALCVLCAPPVFAQSGINFGPESGPQVARGSAWVARADTPLAAFYNPAGLTRQSSSVLGGGLFMSLDRCYERQALNGRPVTAGGGFPAPDSPSVCMSKSPYFNTQLGAAFTLGDRVHVGIAVVGPHAVGKIRWPETVSSARGPQPAPNRFQLVTDDSLLAFPTGSLGYKVTDQLSVGIGFSAGIFSEKATLYAEGLSPAPAAGTQPADDFLAHQEMKVFLEANDRFIPAVVVGMLWSPASTIDFGLAYRKLAKVNADVDLRMESRAWGANGQPNPQPCSAAEGAGCNITDPQGVDGHAIETLPPEIRGGIRYHQPRNPGGISTGDSLDDEKYDIELDVAWANNSIVKEATLDLKEAGGVTLRGVNGVSTLPTKAGVTKNWKDVVSIRGGGEWVARPGRLALQAGAFYESQGQDAKDLHVHFDEASKGGASGGARVRLTRRLDVLLAFQHMLWSDLDNGGAGASGGLSGDPSTDHETRQKTNGGVLSSKMNEFGVWLALRF